MNCEFLVRCNILAGDSFNHPVIFFLGAVFTLLTENRYCFTAILMTSGVSLKAPAVSILSLHEVFLSKNISS